MIGGDAFLLGLFREELSNHSAVLTEGLLTLERGGGSPQAIEPLMRAAHSIKGAARVVDLDAIVSMAHVMEDILVAAGGGGLKMDAVGTDLLLCPRLDGRCGRNRRRGSFRLDDRPCR